MSPCVAGAQRHLSAMRLLLALLFLALPAQAAQPWRDAEWGMDAEALNAAVPGLRDANLIYGAGLRGAFVLTGTELAGLPFRAIFQMGDDGLRQILFEKRRRAIAPDDPARLLASLRNALGPETRLCRDLGGAATWVEAVWRRPDGIAHLVLTDFWTPEILTSRGADPLYNLPTLRREEFRDLRLLSREFEGAGGPKPQALPRRLLFRWHAPEAEDLASPRCPLQD